jgi:hypothetical protein
MYTEQHKYFAGPVAARVIEEIRSKKLIKKKFSREGEPI